MPPQGPDNNPLDPKPRPRVYRPHAKAGSAQRYGQYQGSREAGHGAPPHELFQGQIHSDERHPDWQVMNQFQGYMVDKVSGLMKQIQDGGKMSHIKGPPDELGGVRRSTGTGDHEWGESDPDQNRRWRAKHQAALNAASEQADLEAQHSMPSNAPGLPKAKIKQSGKPPLRYGKMKGRQSPNSTQNPYAGYDPKSHNQNSKKAERPPIPPYKQPKKPKVAVPANKGGPPARKPPPITKTPSPGGAPPISRTPSPKGPPPLKRSPGGGVAALLRKK